MSTRLHIVILEGRKSFRFFHTHPISASSDYPLDTFSVVHIRQFLILFGEGTVLIVRLSLARHLSLSLSLSLSPNTSQFLLLLLLLLLYVLLWFNHSHK